MKIEAYIVLKFYDKDKTKVDTLEKIKEYIYLPPEDYQDFNLKDGKYEDNSSKYYEKINQNRKTLQRIPIYLDKEMAEADADFWVGHTSHDYGVVKKITINLEDDVFNTNLNEQQSLKEYIKENPNCEHSKKELKEWEWYNDK